MIAPSRAALRGVVGVSLAGAALVGCLSTDESDDDPGMDFSAIAVPGAWRLPSDVHAAGQRQYVRYDGAPAWNGGSNCGSGLGAPARALGDHLRRTFPGSVSSYGGFSCRPNTANTSQTSVHGTGRAIDVFIPTTGGQADNTRGDAVANWLVANAQRLGVQYIIWDRTQWNASRSGDKASPYGGPHPHHDHLHVELNTSARPIESCTAHCEAGDVIVDTNCGRGDCSAFGARCVSDGLGTRCVFGTCPAVGSATICVNDRTLATCSNGSARAGDCAAFAAWCSTAGRAPTEARCVSAFCVSGPSERPVAHTACWIEGGQLLRCDANGGATPAPCPAGQACSVIGGTARCAPRVCPATGESDLCVDDRYIAHCYGGSVGRATDCRAMGRVCQAAGSGGPRCVVPAVDAGAVDVVVRTATGSTRPSTTRTTPAPPWTTRVTSTRGPPGPTRRASARTPQTARTSRTPQTPGRCSRRPPSRGAARAGQGRRDPPGAGRGRSWASRSWPSAPGLAVATSATAGTRGPEPSARPRSSGAPLRTRRRRGAARGREGRKRRRPLVARAGGGAISAPRGRLRARGSGSSRADRRAATRT